MDSDENLEHCLQFLKGSTDEQRMVGLLLATKYVQGDNKDSILQVFDAMGVQFINRLLKSGLCLTSSETLVEEEPYVQLALSVLSAFCRVPELASLDEIINKIPILLDILKKKPADPVVVDCCEILLGIGSASQKGLLCLQQSRAFSIVTSYLSTSAADTASFHSSVKLVQLLLVSGVPEEDIAECADIVVAISVLAKQLASDHGSLKFEALLLLRTLCSSNILVRIKKNMIGDLDWAECIRVGIGHILQSRVVVDQKHLALELTKSMVEYFGGSWLFGPVRLPREVETVQLDRFFILLVQTLRVETAVLLGDIARVRFDSDDSHACLSDCEKRQHTLAICYALLENIMNIISENAEDASRLSEMTLEKTVISLYETVNTVFEFLQEAKSKNITKGDDLIASARLIGRYVAEDAAPAHRKLFLTLLEYLFSISPEHEDSPFLVVQFLLPALCQVTTDKEGCKALVSWGGHKQVIHCMVASLETREGPSRFIVGTCDIILNLLQKENRISADIMVPDFLPILSSLPSWAVNENKIMEISLAACVCVMVLDMTREDVILQMTSMDTLSNIYRLIIKVLECFQRSQTATNPAEEEDLWEATISTCVGLLNRYPSLKDTLRCSVWLKQFLQERSRHTLKMLVVNSSLQSLLSLLLCE